MIRRLVRAVAARLRRAPGTPPAVHRRLDDGWPHTDIRIAAEENRRWL